MMNYPFISRIKYKNNNIITIAIKNSKDFNNENENDNNNNNNNNNKVVIPQRNPEDDEDFKAWVTSNLKNWPLKPSSQQEITKQQQSNNNNQNLQDAIRQEITTTSYSNNNNNQNLQDAIRQEITTTSYSNNNNNNNIDETTLLRSPLSRVLNIKALLRIAQKAELQQQQQKENNNNNNNNNWNTNNITALEELGGIYEWVDGLVGQQQSTTSTIGKSAGGLFKQATARVESIVSEASSAVSPETIESIIKWSSQVVANVTSTSSSSDSIMEETTTTLTTDIEPDNVKQPGLNVSETVSRAAMETVAYAGSILKVADEVFRKGYIKDDPVVEKQKKEKEELLINVPKVAGSKALFESYPSAIELNTITPPLVKAAEMGALSGAIYEETLPRTMALKHTIVTRGTTEDVAWMVTDSIANRTSFTTNYNKLNNKNSNQDDDEPFLVRTITIRGFDASDENVDRERLLNRVCTADPEPFNNKVNIHSGLHDIAKDIFNDIKQYIDWIAPNHKIILNGHSIGGSLSLIVLFLMISEYGSDFVNKKVVQVYTFGSPPVLVCSKDKKLDVLETFDIPKSLVQGFVQPWDPVVRLFSEIDALYPLVGDLGEDGVTPWANGPPRTLRPVTKAILEAWDGWPRFRQNYKGTANQTYTSVGEQHLLLPGPTRYLADRFVAVNIPVPPVETILRISNKELYPALSTAFPLDEFEISFIPQAIRSFVHHFYPAYGFPLVDYMKELQRRSRGLPERPSEFSFTEDEIRQTIPATTVVNGAGGSSSSNSDQDFGIDWTKATQWFTRNEPNNSV